MPIFPFLKDKNRNAGGIATEYRKPDEGAEKSDNGLEACAADILRAVTEGNAKALAGAIQAAFDICNSMPSEEPSIEPNQDQ